MKKILSFALCAAAVSAFAVDESSPKVAELGIVGVTAITTSLSNAIVAVSYDDLAGGSGIVVSNFVKTANLTEGDQLAIFNNGTGTEIYDTWVLRENDNKVLYWAKNDKTFYVDANGLQQGEGMSASSITNAVGTGIWLVRQNPTKDGKTLPFYIYGKPVSDPVSHILPGTWTLVGNPLQRTAKIGSSTVSDVQTGDQIVTAEEDGKLHYHTFIGSQWTGSPITIDPGLGFWIKTEGETTITWTNTEE